MKKNFFALVGAKNIRRGHPHDFGHFSEVDFWQKFKKIAILDSRTSIIVLCFGTAEIVTDFKRVALVIN